MRLRVLGLGLRVEGFRGLGSRGLGLRVDGFRWLRAKYEGVVFGFRAV